MKSNKHALALEAIMHVIEPSLEKLHAAGNVKTPDRTEAVTAIANCLSARNGQWRRTRPPGGYDSPSRLLWDLVKFHRSNGNLWGYPFLADESLRDRMDTLALVLLGNQSNAANAWRRALKV